jgi:hypothetical protein
MAALLVGLIPTVLFLAIQKTKHPEGHLVICQAPTIFKALLITRIKEVRL